MRYRQTNAGFTLVEVILVVAIIGILVAIVVPQYQSYCNRAYDGASMVDLKNMKTGIEAFRSDFEGYPGTILFASTGP